MSQNDFDPKDQLLIDDEVTRYEATFRRIQDELRAKTNELGHDEKLARELTAELVATKRDEEKQFLLSDEQVAHGLAHLRFKQANALSDLSRQPYFARVVYNERGRDVEFKLGVASLPEERIIDWRKAPISKLYYDYEEGEEYDDEIAGVERQGVVKLKRAYRGEFDELTNVELKDVSYVKNKGQWSRFRKQSQTMFSVKDKEKVREILKSHAPLSLEQLGATDGYLSQILSLLSPEQFRLISSDLSRPVIIQGSAGTGKTTVALHRLAWLLFEENSPAKEEHSLVVMFSPTLAHYVEKILPSLGVHGVKIATYEDWLKDASRAVKKYPTSLDYLVIDEAQDFTLAEIKKLVDVLKDKNQLMIAGDLGQKILENRDFGTWQELLEKLGLKGVDVLNLSIAYRSTYQIYEIAEYVRDPSLADEDLKMTPRFGPEPLLTVCHNFNEAIDMTRSWIEDVININQRVVGAVVCRTPQEARLVYEALLRQNVHGVRFGDAQHFEFTPGITITDVRQVKGLEFQCLLLFNPSEKKYQANSAQDRNLLYVAVTRAVFKLDMVCYEPVSSILPEFINVRDLTAVVEEDTAEGKFLFGEEQSEFNRAKGIKEEETESEEESEDRDMLDELQTGVEDDDVEDFDELNEEDDFEDED